MDVIHYRIRVRLTINRQNYIKYPAVDYLNENITNLIGHQTKYRVIQREMEIFDIEVYTLEDLKKVSLLSWD